MPTHGLHLPDGSEIERLFLQRISREYRGKAGPYLRNLVDRDLAEPEREPAPSPIAPDVMESLTRILCGHTKGQRMRAALAGADQVQELTDLLESHLLTLEADAREGVAGIDKVAAVLAAGEVSQAAADRAVAAKARGTVKPAPPRRAG